MSSSVLCLATGGRDFPQKSEYKAQVESWLSHVLELYDIEELVLGKAAGADTFLEYWGKDQGINLTLMPANWTKYSKKAGPLRNERMLLYALSRKKDRNAIRLIHLPGLKGTEHMVSIAKKANITVLSWEPNNI